MRKNHFSKNENYKQIKLELIREIQSLPLDVVVKFLKTKGAMKKSEKGKLLIVTQNK